jgi:ubiquinone/menaquinone biosynthesis C-methylase UbiE
MITGFELIDNWYENPLGRLYLQRVIAKLNELLNNEEKDVYALDAGCGSGHYSLFLAENGYRAIGVDKSEVLVSKAYKKSKSFSKRVNFLVADISSLPFPSNFFKLIICFNVIEFVPNREKAIGELKRVLAPDGLLLLGVCNKNSIWGLLKMIGRPFRNNDPFFKGCFFSRGDLIELADKAGFELRQIKDEIYFPPIKNTRLAILCERIGKKCFKWLPGFLIASLTKPMLSNQLLI